MEKCKGHRTAKVTFQKDTIREFTLPDCETDKAAVIQAV